MAQGHCFFRKVFVIRIEVQKDKLQRSAFGKLRKLREIDNFALDIDARKQKFIRRIISIAQSMQAVDLLDLADGNALAVRSLCRNIGRKSAVFKPIKQKVMATAIHVRAVVKTATKFNILYLFM